MALYCDTDTQPSDLKEIWWVRGRGFSGEAEVKTKVELNLVQILVVVAIIQMRTLKAEVEKGSMWTAIGHGLLDPKTRRKRLKWRIYLRSRKGMRLIFLKLDVDIVW